MLFNKTCIFSMFFASTYCVCDVSSGNFFHCFIDNVTYNAFSYNSVWGDNVTYNAFSYNSVWGDNVTYNTFPPTHCCFCCTFGKTCDVKDVAGNLHFQDHPRRQRWSSGSAGNWRPHTCRERRHFTPTVHLAVQFYLMYCIFTLAVPLTV